MKIKASVEHFQSLREIGNQVVRVLDSDGEAEHAGGDAHFPAMRVRHMAVGRGNGMVQCCVDAAQGRCIPGEMQLLHKLVDLGPVLGDDEAHHAAHGLIGGKELLSQRMLRETLQAGVVYLGDMGIGLQGGGQLGRVGHLLLQAQVDGLQIVGHRPGVKGIAGGAAEHPDGMDRVDDLRSGGNRTGDGVAVAVHELCHGADDDVGTLVQGANGDRGGEGVIDHQIGAVAVGDLGQGRDVGDVQSGVRQHLGVNQLGVGLDSLADIINVVKADQVALNAELCHQLCHDVKRFAIDVAVADNVVAGLQNGHERGGDGAHTGGKDQRLLSVLQIGDHVGQRLAVGVVGPDIGEFRPVGLVHLIQVVHGVACGGEQRKRGGVIEGLTLGGFTAIKDFRRH